MHCTSAAIDTVRAGNHPGRIGLSSLSSIGEGGAVHWELAMAVDKTVLWDNGAAGKGVF